MHDYGSNAMVGCHRKSVIQRNETPTRAAPPTTMHAPELQSGVTESVNAHARKDVGDDRREIGLGHISIALTQLLPGIILSRNKWGRGFQLAPQIILPSPRHRQRRARLGCPLDTADDPGNAVQEEGFDRCDGHSHRTSDDDCTGYADFDRNCTSPRSIKAITNVVNR